MQKNKKENNAYDELRKSGFVADEFFASDPDIPTYGLNIALSWPLPENLKKAYEKLHQELLELGEDGHVYPYERTHVTVMTLVNFKKHQNPSVQEIEGIEKLIPKIIHIISGKLQNEMRGKIKPFRIEIGSPVLARAAAYLPISNPSGEIFLLRNEIAPILEKELSLEILYNKDFIHSTIMRFCRVPEDLGKFIDKFQEIAERNKIGETIIDEFYITSETKPYMRDGEKVHVFKL